MATIFISHSKHDQDAVHFFLKAFAGTKVRPVLEEFEQGVPGGANASKIAADINAANALFVLLGSHVESLQHTRDWVNWECGTAVNKPIWVFEPLELSANLTVAVPRVTDLARYQRTDGWRRYLQAAISGYDDSHVVPAVGAAAGLGALANKDRFAGGFFGALIGAGLLVLDAWAKPQIGTTTQCWNCRSNYRVHLPSDVYVFRCATCNAHCNLTQKVGLPARG